MNDGMVDDPVFRIVRVRTVYAIMVWIEVVVHHVGVIPIRAAYLEILESIIKDSYSV